MKTPKRTIPCPQCGAPCELGISVIESWDERYEVPALFCTRSGEEVVGNAKAICARWIRKNREARLRHALREMKWQIDVKKAQLKGCWSACVTYRKAVSASGTYGQDIEGS